MMQYRVFRKFLLVTILFNVAFYELQAQRSCGFTAYQEYIHNKFGIQQDDEAFEQWMRQISYDKSARQQANGVTTTVATIPVVVHVIHNGEEQGQGSNIPEAQIISQIDTLNRDFRRLNADTVNTPDNLSLIHI